MNGMIPKVRGSAVGWLGGTVVVIMNDEISPFESVVRTAVVIGVAEGEGVGTVSCGASVVKVAWMVETPPPTFAGMGVVAAEAVVAAATAVDKEDGEAGMGWTARGRAEAPIGRVVRETTPLEVTGHTNWKVVITRTCDMETMSSWV